MRRLVPKLLASSLVLIAALAMASSALAAPALTGTFELGTKITGNNKLVAGPDGNVWFTLSGKKVGKISPAGIVQIYELSGIENAIGISVGPEKRIWIVAKGKATSFLPADPEGTEEDFESALIKDEPNIVLGPDSKFWVASSEAVMNFSPGNFNGTAAPVTLEGMLSPKDIDVAGSRIAISDNFNNPMTEKGRIVTYNAAGEQKDVEIPGGSQGLAGSSSGQIAFSAALATPEQAGLVTPPAPYSSFELLGDPFGVALGSDGAFWIVDFNFGGLTRVTTTGQTSFLGGMPTFTARQIAAGPGNTLWVTLPDEGGEVGNKSAIARISGVDPPVVTPPSTTNPPPPTTKPAPPVPETTLGKGAKKIVKVAAGKATVKFTFSSSVAGSTFQCANVKLPTGKPAKGKKRKVPQPNFAGCSSPKVLKLGPGKYRFAVRAVAGGITDATPAQYGFKVVRAPRHK
jgi:hypothetical protein